ncbi:hypothetical protein Tco_1111280 [Tanacetum coccineum]|uniref:Uncharacterized protein n=1 Tax=Tanacetum coccineum TaxID=301880 RepID=A0ABQ5IL87_9ASTR
MYNNTYTADAHTLNSIRYRKDVEALEDVVEDEPHFFAKRVVHGVDRKKDRKEGKEGGGGGCNRGGGWLAKRLIVSNEGCGGGGLAVRGGRSLSESKKGRVPFEQRDEQPEQPRVIYPPTLDINHFCHFLNFLENHNPMDDEPMWAADRVVALIACLTITIPEPTNEFAIKGNGYSLKDKNEAKTDKIELDNR